MLQARHDADSRRRVTVADTKTGGAWCATGVLVRMTISIAAVALIIGAVTFALPQAATAKPEFAAKTGFPCGQCHVSPTGGGTLKPYGQAFKANGFEVPKKKK
jgi:hypothetical protein